MQWNDAAIVLSVKKHGEHGAFVRVFCENRGLISGYAIAAMSRKQRGVFQPGNIVRAAWSARTAEQLGRLSAELATPVAALALSDAKKLSALSSACVLCLATLAENHPEPSLWQVYERFLMRLCEGGHWLEEYADFEFALLSACGFRLDLEECAATGATESLVYISPKSGRAVSAEAGEPYKDKLFAIPDFLCDPTQRPGEEDIAQALAISGHFLDTWLFSHHGLHLPAARARFIAMLHLREVARRG